MLEWDESREGLINGGFSYAFNNGWVPGPLGTLSCFIAALALSWGRLLISQFQSSNWRGLRLAAGLPP